MKRAIFYISAATDLDEEREILGRAVVEVPVDLGWRVVQSPAGNGPVDLDAVASAGVHVLLMGADIRAPIGLEWQVAWQAGRYPIVYLKDGILRTPAGQDFVKLVAGVQRWEHYADVVDLQRKVLRRLADHVFDQAVAYALTPDEISALVAWRDKLATAVEDGDEEKGHGAGDSSVLLSRQRLEPHGGVEIGKR